MRSPFGGNLWSRHSTADNRGKEPDIQLAKYRDSMLKKRITEKLAVGRRDDATVVCWIMPL